MATTQFEKGTDPLTQRVDASFLTQGFIIFIIIIIIIIMSHANEYF